ncbi:Biotin transporter BioY [Lactobacillus helveticus]|nr:Biotin transporter BioY [Lactobacillus helveticus]
MKIREIVQTALITATIIILGMISPLPLGFIPVPIVMQNLGIMLAAVILGRNFRTQKRNPGDFRVPLAGVDWFSSAQWWSGRACIFCRTNWRLFARVVINATHDRLWSFPAIY